MLATWNPFWNRPPRIPLNLGAGGCPVVHHFGSHGFHRLRAFFHPLRSHSHFRRRRPGPGGRRRAPLCPDAHEMLARFDHADTLKGKLSACVTPYLYGRPWLEKPALYYWRAMFVFQEFGVHDWSARLPSASFAFIMVALIYLHMRRFRPGGHLDAALITVACAGIIGFSRGASTDMQMAAPLCHRPARLVRLVRDRLQVLALRYLLLYRRGHARQGSRGALPGRRHRLLPLPRCARSGPSCAAPSGGPACCSTSPSSCPGSSPSSTRTPPSSASSSSIRTCAASPPTATSTSSRSGITSSSCCWRSCPGRWLPSARSGTAFRPRSPSGVCATPAAFHPRSTAPATLFPSSSSSGR